jgi:hypothetical protein
LAKGNDDDDDDDSVHVNSRPWSVNDNKQLLKPRKMWAKMKPQVKANSRIIIIRLTCIKYFKIHITILNIS